MGLYDSLYGQQYSDLTTPEDQTAAKRKAMMAITAQLLQAGGPSRLPISTGQAIGSALQAGGQAQDQSYQSALQAALLRARLQPQPKQPGVHVVNGALVDDTGRVVYQGEKDAKSNIGAYQPGDYTPASWADFLDTGDARKLERHTTARQEYAPSFQNITRTRPDGSTEMGKFNTRTGEYEWSGQVVPAGVKARTEAQARAEGEAAGGQAAKAPAQASMDYVIDRFRGVIDKTPQGGPMGAKSVTGLFTDFQQTREFDNLREQLSTEIRTAFRIPGEGTLSDREQAQYGIQLPDRKNASFLNNKILDDIKARTGLRLGTNVGGPRASATGPVRVKVDAQGNVIGN